MGNKEKEISKRYYKKHKDELKEKSRIYYNGHKEERKEYRDGRKERTREIGKKYYENHRKKEKITFECSICHKSIGNRSNIKKHINVCQSPVVHLFCSKECKNKWINKKRGFKFGNFRKHKNSSKVL